MHDWKCKHDLGSNVSLMPCSIFKRLGLGKLRPSNISLQLADRYIKYPLCISKHVPIKVGDLSVHIDFMILDMAKDSHTQIILGRPVLTTVGCKMWGRPTFDVGENHACNAPTEHGILFTSLIIIIKFDW